MKFVLSFLAIKTLWFFMGIQAIKQHHQMTGVEIKSSLARDLWVALVIPDITWIFMFFFFGIIYLVFYSTSENTKTS